jgi:hypothetical protein
MVSCLVHLIRKSSGYLITFNIRLLHSSISTLDMFGICISSTHAYRMQETDDWLLAPTAELPKGAAEPGSAET